MTSTFERSGNNAWKWYVCGMLLLATMLNYMDRQTLSQTKTRIEKDPSVQLTDAEYGNLEFGFGIAFALGGIVSGLMVDRLGVRWLYPALILAWSGAGFATAHALQIGEFLRSLGWFADMKPGYLGLIVCRVALGLFEAGQWPCALVTSQRLLAAKDRTLGNSILQSGASLGAVLTPLCVQALVTDDPTTWRGPFQVIGALGMLWVIPWLLMVRSRDLATQVVETSTSQRPQPGGTAAGLLIRRYLVLVAVVILINLFWQFFRAWLPSLLEKHHGYTFRQVQIFTSVWFIMTDVGCIAFGAASKWLAHRGWRVHHARLAVFLGCSLFTALGLVAARLPKGPWLLAVLLCVAFGSLGLFATYYSLTQELSVRRQGIVTGSLGCITWMCAAGMQKLVGKSIQSSQGGSYALIISILALGPLLACIILWLFWGERRQRAAQA